MESLRPPSLQLLVKRMRGPGPAARVQSGTRDRVADDARRLLALPRRPEVVKP